MALEKECPEEVRIAVEERDEDAKWEKHCIYKLPASITDLKRSAYRPRSISFGPYHNGNPKLKPMEEHKARVLRGFLKRVEKSMEECVAALNFDAEELMDAYSSLKQEWRKNPAKFMKVMIRDGCFMLEIMEYLYDSVHFKRQYAHKDPIFSDHGKMLVMPFIRRDMLLLENQLPMSLLIRLLSLGGHHRKTCDELMAGDEYTMKLIARFCMPFAELEAAEIKNLRSCKHVLHVRRELLLAGKEIPRKKAPSVWLKMKRKCTLRYDRYASGKVDRNKLVQEVIDFGANIIPSATRLDESGIAIRMSGSKSITSIRFYAGPVGGILEIPPIVVDDTTEPLFLNLLAFERLDPDVTNDVTSYIHFMDDIIDNAQDVRILQSHGIVSNSIGSDTAVAELFNSLSKDTVMDLGSDLIRVRYRAREHCRRKWNKAYGSLIRTYFINAWTTTTLIAAVLAFLLAIASTIFAILDYFKKK